MSSLPHGRIGRTGFGKGLISRHKPFTLRESNASRGDWMITFLHASDLHLGRRFGRFDQDLGTLLADERFSALSRLADAARKGGASMIVLAGDTFDAEVPEERGLRRAMAAMSDASDMTWVLLPGNHDPLGKGGLWRRVAEAGPDNVTILSEPEPIQLTDTVWALPAPCCGETAGGDPTAWMDAGATPEGAVRLGIAHGPVLAFTEETTGAVIAPDRAARAGLDYLALGDWHGWRMIGDRTLYPGTPEPDRFRDGAGHAALVSIAGPGATPRIAACPTARFHWREAVLDLGVQPDPKAGIGEILPDGRKLPDTLLKLTLTGTVRMADRAAWTRALDDLGDTLRWLDINDSTLISLIEADDLDRIGRQGALRDAAEALNAARQDMSRTPEDRAAAGLALDLLVSWALEAEDTA